MNFLASLPDASQAEQVTELLTRKNVRIERIVSQGQCSAVDDWYDQSEDEWVMVIKGKARLELDDGQLIEMGPGDSIFLQAHQRHRVDWTTPDEPTLWLAVFFEHQPA